MTIPPMTDGTKTNTLDDTSSTGTATRSTSTTNQSGEDIATTPGASATTTTTTMIRSMLPIRMQSIVVRGFGRGSSDLGIPTANLDCQVLSSNDSKNKDDNKNNNNKGLGAWSIPQQRAPSLEDLPTGIYWGYARICHDDNEDDRHDSSKPNEQQADKATLSSSQQQQVYTAAISIGYNPTYGNQQKTIEPHLIAPPHDPRRHVSLCGETVLSDFYNERIRLSVCGYLRPELPFEGLDQLIQAIKQDICTATELGDLSSSSSSLEKAMAQREHEWVAATTMDVTLP